MTITVDMAADMFLKACPEWCAQSTVIHYRKRLKPLRADLGTRLVTEVNEQDIKDFIARSSLFEDGTHKAPDTIRGGMVTIDVFQRWLLKQKFIKALIAPEMKKPMGRQRDLIPTPEETKLIIDQARADFVPVFRALRLTGARPCELCAAQIPDYDRTAAEIRLVQHKTARKTGKARRITVAHPALIEIINTAIGTRTEGHIFLRYNERPWRTGLLSASYLAARKAAGITRPLVLYLARHEHATFTYRLTGDLKAVADALGHANIQTSMRYARADPERMRKNQSQFDEGLGDHGFSNPDKP